MRSVLAATVMAAFCCVLYAQTLAAGDGVAVEADLLVVGGTESGCAAAVQAARMGVKRIVLVNDIEWLGGQFSAEAVGAIDENRAHGYNGSVPIPRSGIFKDVIDAIEESNAALYGGVRRPGNTRVITTARPAVSEQVFRKLLAPFEKSGQISRYSGYSVDSVLTQGPRAKGNRVMGAKFRHSAGRATLTVNARMTIDASDWGDVIKGSGAKWDAGVDAQSEFNEPAAPVSGKPATDINPITWCMILEQQKTETLVAEPAGYDPRYFIGLWGWIDGKFAYTSRRLVDGQGYKAINHPDVLLINSPPTDYPLDVYPAHVATALEAVEAGASKKNLVAMTPQQREIVFKDARQHSLKFYYHLQQRFPEFRKMALSNEFGTRDKLPPKPYIREGLRLGAQHIIREQEVTGFGSRANYAATMFPDAVFCWQFELDFHPTKRSWTTDRKENGPWEASFRGNRRFGRGGTGRCVFPLRALTPQGVHGLLAAQKNLGFTSIVGSSCRLHDQSIHAGQASGCVAAISLLHNENPAEFYLNRQRVAEIWTALLEPVEGAPLVIWPFADVDPSEPGFAAIQQLALRRLLTPGASDTSYYPGKVASPAWIAGLLATVKKAGYANVQLPAVEGGATRAQVAIELWKKLSVMPLPPVNRKHKSDADGDGIADTDDPLPFTPGIVSWRVEADKDGVPDPLMLQAQGVLAFNFTSSGGPAVKGFQQDAGAVFNAETKSGWLRDLTKNTRLRGAVSGTPRDGFVFTRNQDSWECEVENGQWEVHVCLGDAGHEQPGQHLWIEANQVAAKLDTAAGHFQEFSRTVEVRDGRLTLTAGVPEGGSNTCINWLVLKPASRKK